jgi:hypothetical protein
MTGNVGDGQCGRKAKSARNGLARDYLERMLKRKKGASLGSPEACTWVGSKSVAFAAAGIIAIPNSQQSPMFAHIGREPR